MSNFIILLGGPGKFVGCDKAHDQTWKNYLVPIQLAGQNNLYNSTVDEKVHWLVYEPAYINRWDDDSVIDATEKKQDDGYGLHSIRKKAADKVFAAGAANYLQKIRHVASSVGATYKGISKPGEFWSYLQSFPPSSISRVWYSGHAAEDGLMLSLTHDSSCVAGAHKTDAIQFMDIKSHADLADRFIKPSTKSFKFYGCYTSKFAKEWKDVFGVPAEGAVNKIDFGSIDRPSPITNVLKRIEETHTSYGSPDWRVHK